MRLLLLLKNINKFFAGAFFNTEYTDGTEPKRYTEFLKEHGNETPPSLPQGEECLTGAGEKKPPESPTKEGMFYPEAFSLIQKCDNLYSC